MRRTTRPRLLAIWLLVGAASIGPELATAATLATAPAGADDADSCAKASGDAAIAACTRAIASGNYRGHALEKLYHDRAFEYYNKRDNDRAIADYDEAIRLDPTYTFAYYNRGDAWEQKHDFQKALADYNKFVELAPTDSDGPRAVERITKALVANDSGPDVASRSSVEVPSGAAAPYDGIHQLVGATRATPSASPIRTGLSEIETNPEFGSR